MKCYADVRVNAYVLGSGPPTLTALVWDRSYWSDGEPEDVEGLRTYLEHVIIEEGERRSETSDPGGVPGGGLEGIEMVLFLGPSVDVSAESWEVITMWGMWDLERREDGTVVAVHPLRDAWKRARPDAYQTYRSMLEMELPTFKQAVTEAHQERLTEHGGRTAADPIYPMLLTDAHDLTEFMESIGAYDHPDGPPVQPPAVYTCDNDTAVADSSTNRALVRDCSALLAGKDTLVGTASLDWAADSAVTGWEGVTTGGTPSQVTKVELPNEGLSGSIPAQLWELAGLTHLDLADNSLTGEIPRALRWLAANLESLKLSGNSLTGCIPLPLEDVASNDLSSLNIPYCRPPGPENLRVGTPAERSIPLSWDAVSNTSKYRVEYWVSGVTAWNLDDDTITGTSHTVDGLLCEQKHYFRVSAYGSGTTYAAAWGGVVGLPVRDHCQVHSTSVRGLLLQLRDSGRRRDWDRGGDRRGHRWR